MEQSVETLLKNIRRELHANPEVSGDEHATQKRILQFLSEHSNAATTPIANTGVLATFDSGRSGDTILIRGDIDALPIQESNDFEHRSKVDGVSHKCGHDGHTTILLGLTMKLTKNTITKGKVLLVFQPAEENGMGAQAVLKDPEFDKLRIDYVFALHNLPGFETHQIVVKEQEFTANVKSIIIKLHGKTAHAAEPEFGHNPAGIISEILQYAEEHTLNQPSSRDFFLYTPVYATLGEKAYGISAGYGEVHLTIRSWSTELMKVECENLVEFIEARCRHHNLRPDISWTQVFHANENDPEVVEVIRKAIAANDFDYTEAANPFKWGEDFGLFTQKYKGAMFGIGAGIDTPALHNPDYDFPDAITPTAIDMFYSIISEINKH